MTDAVDSGAAAAARAWERLEPFPLSTVVTVAAPPELHLTLLPLDG